MKKPIGDGPVIVKKYANRRLYNTETSSYITLDHLAAMTREGRDFKVIDAKSEEDITHNVLTQINHGRGKSGRDDAAGQLPAPAESRCTVIRCRRWCQVIWRRRWTASVATRHSSSPRWEGAFANSPFAEIAKRNMAMFEAAANAFKPGATVPGAATPGGKDAEIASLRAELERLQEKVDRLR